MSDTESVTPLLLIFLMQVYTGKEQLGQKYVY